MIRHDFEFFAGLLAQYPEVINGASKKYLIKRIADYCQDNNARFDRDKFEKACGI